MQKPLSPQPRTQCTVLSVSQTKASLNQGALSSEGWVEGEGEGVGFTEGSMWGFVW